MKNNMVWTHNTEQNRSNLSEAIFLVENNQLVQNHRHCQKPLTWSNLFVKNNQLVENHRLGEKQSTWSKLTKTTSMTNNRSEPITLNKSDQTCQKPSYWSKKNNWSKTIDMVKNSHQNRPPIGRKQSTGQKPSTWSKNINMVKIVGLKQSTGPKPSAWSKTINMIKQYGLNP